MIESPFGRWDLVVTGPEKAFPSWVELIPTGGRFVGEVGSARPIARVEVDGSNVTWQLPRQYEGRKTDLVFTGQLVDGELKGTTIANDDETEISWVGKPAPALPLRADAKLGASVELVGPDLSNWTLRSPDWVSNWAITEEGLHNSAVGSDLISVATFTDFHLVAEYRYPAGSNSGIYLRGRYEFQILDDLGVASHVGGSGAIYGFLTPKQNAVLPPDAWQKAEITVNGRFVSVTLNGELVLDQQEIPGITGGALDSNEGVPGPIFLQGDHGPITFRRVTITPLD